MILVLVLVRLLLLLRLLIVRMALLRLVRILLRRSGAVVCGCRWSVLWRRILLWLRGERRRGGPRGLCGGL